MKKKNRSRLDRRLKNTNSNKPDDRLSSLPDDVICRILYFLPTTKSYVQTSVLAKGWRRLWTRVTSLEFGSKDEPLADSKTINEVMSRHKGQTIHTFHLHFPENYDHNSCTDSELESWIVTAVEGGVRYLLIHFHHQLIKLPTCLFTTKTLVDLTLRDCGNIPAGPTACNFPALKKLVLDNVWYESDESLPRLLSGCPVLDELAVKFEYSQINIEVRLSTLTRLTVDSGLGYESVHKLSLDTPALRCLHLRSRRFEILSAGTLTCLTEADVYSNVHRYYYDSDWEGDDDDEIERKVSYSRSVTEFVGELYNVECLKLVTFGIVPYPTFPDLSHKFRNLTELNLRDGFCFLTSFLENADSLRLLTMVGCYDWKEPKQVPACLISSLEAVTLDEYQFCEECEFEMVRYILRNGKVLKRMSITIRDYGYNYPSYKKEKFEALKRLALFERGSDSCRLAFEIISS